jgi:hypothetical protein
MRDQVISVRASQSTTPQALELVNGETLTRRLSRGARRMLGELPPEPVSLYTRAVAGRPASSSVFDIDISRLGCGWWCRSTDRTTPSWCSRHGRKRS